MEDVIDFYKEHEPDSTLQVKDICSSYWAARQVEAELVAFHAEELYNIVPYERGLEPHPRGVPILMDYEVDDEFDWDSIMMYNSWVGPAKDDKSPTMVRKDNGKLFEDNKKISAGDGKS